MKYTITAVIPVMQYGNIQPSIEVEADTFEQAHAQAMPYIENVWNSYGEKPLTSKAGATTHLTDYFGNKIDYDKVNHVYSWKGELYESGSQYASKFEKPFDKQNIASKMATKYGVSPQDIIDMWELNGRTSMEFGTAIHSALELYGKHKELAVALERDSALHSHPVIRKAVEGFYKGRENERAAYEVLVVDHTNKRAGRIDRLSLGETSKDAVQVQDYKTGAEIKPDKQKVYFKQLDFYTEILEANGLKTRPPVIFHWDGEWHTINKQGVKL